MGADFTFATIPRAKATGERRKELRRLLNTLTDKDLEELESFTGNSIRELKNDIEEYWNLIEYRDVSTIRIGRSIPHLITGGLTYGDSPTDSYDVISRLNLVSKIFYILEKWAREDKKKA